MHWRCTILWVPIFCVSVPSPESSSIQPEQPVYNQVTLSSYQSHNYSGRASTTTYYCIKIIRNRFINVKNSDNSEQTCPRVNSASPRWSTSLLRPSLSSSITTTLQKVCLSNTYGISIPVPNIGFRLFFTFSVLPACQGDISVHCTVLELKPCIVMKCYCDDIYS